MTYNTQAIGIRTDLNVTGQVSKGGGSFTIPHPHPDKKETHHLVHSFMESPQADLVYTGMVDLGDGGKATVNLDFDTGMTPGTFALLCKNVRYTAKNESGFTLQSC